MAKEFAKAFYHSRQWKKCRDSYIRQRIGIDGGLCELCQSSLGYIVHHKEMLNENNIHDPDVTLSFDNLQYVCKQCHDDLEGHGVVRKKKMLVFFDKNGNPIGKISENTPLFKDWVTETPAPGVAIGLKRRKFL